MVVSLHAAITFLDLKLKLQTSDWMMQSMLAFCNDVNLCAKETNDFFMPDIIAVLASHTGISATTNVS